ncbi:MAG: PASTA domain-containing protein, partial [Solirubrobacteraceae bacterium]
RSRRPPARSRGPAPGATPEPTRPVAPLTPRRTVNPAARRRAIAALGAVLVLLASMVAAAIVIGAHGSTRVPVLTGLRRAAAGARARRAHLTVRFTAAYAHARVGTAIAQRPAAGIRVADAAGVTVTLSRGPAPVEVQLLVGEDAVDAAARVRRLGLTPAVAQVPAPGIAPGTVVAQSPAGGHSAAAGSRVVLSVAEVPQWRPVTTFSGRQSVVFRIRGDRWRAIYRMAFQGTCTFIFFCSGPNARVADITTATTVAGFGLNDGGDQIRTFATGPGLYQIDVTPGGDDADWSVEVQDDY